METPMCETSKRNKLHVQLHIFLLQKQYWRQKGRVAKANISKGGREGGGTDVAPITPDQDPTDFCILLSDMVQRKVTQISNWWG